jgi:predicted lipoprotein with Yx(FWY)xxD motif
MAGAAALVVLSGCGSTSATSAAASPHQSAAAQVPALVRVGSVSVKGKTLKVLENAKGYTLYYFSKDQPTKIACDNAVCHAFWHPLTAKSVPAHMAGLPGKFSVFDGQVEYNGHPLYTYVGDLKPGTANGQGIQHAWYVATPNLQAGSASTSWGSSSSGSGATSQSQTSSNTTATSHSKASSGGSGW